MSTRLITRLKHAYLALKGRQLSREVTTTLPAISADDIADAKAFFPLDKFFIFGHARSGTTVLVRLIRLHPEVHCNYQAHFFTRHPLLQSLVEDEAIREWLSRKSNRWNQGKDLSPLVIRVVADFIMEREARQNGARIVGDKSPNSLVDGHAVELMHKVYPDARLIYIVRDGRDVVLSHRLQAFIDFPDQLSPEDQKIREEFVHNSTPFLQRQRSLFSPKSLHSAAERWMRNVEKTHALGKKLFAERYMAIRYEDLLASPWASLCSLWKFLGVSSIDDELEDEVTNELSFNPDQKWQLERAEDIASAFQKGRRGNWRQHLTEEDIIAFQKIAGDTLTAWGYNLFQPDEEFEP